MQSFVLNSMSQLDKFSCTTSHFPIFLKDDQPKQAGLTERHLSGYVPFTPPESPSCPHRGVQGKDDLRDECILLLFITINVTVPISSYPEWLGTNSEIIPLMSGFSTAARHAVPPPR